MAMIAGRVAGKMAAKQAGKQVAKKQMKKQVKKKVQKKVQQKVEDKAQEKLQERMQESMDKRREKKAGKKKKKKKKKKPRFMGPVKMDIRDELGIGDMDIDMDDMKGMMMDQMKGPKLGPGLFKSGGQGSDDDLGDDREPRKGVRFSIFALCRCVGKFYRYLGRYLPCCRTGTFANQITKNVAGFFCGLLFLAIFYPIFILALRQEPKHAALSVSLIGPVVCFGMAFSPRIRCVMLLMIPGLFSGKGRTILMAYGFLLVLSGPVENLSYNMDMAGQSQVCGSELAMNQTYKLFQVVTAPMASFTGEVTSLIDKLRSIGRRIKEGFRAIKDAIKALGNATAEFFDWVGSMVDKCNEKLGIPERRCRLAFDHAAFICRRDAWIFQFVCGIIDLVSNVCYIAGLLKILCLFPRLIKFIASKASDAIDKALEKVKEQFYVDFEFTHEMRVDYNFSQSARQIRENILGEMEERTDTFVTVVTWLNRLVSFAFILLLLKACKYYHNYRVKDKHDNWYVTDYMQMIDEKQEALGRETLLPLKRKERRKYITTTSVYLARPEKRRIVLGFVMWSTQVCYAVVLMVADCMAYWFLDLVRMHSELNVHINSPGSVTLDVQGEGILAEIYRSLVQSFDPRHISNFEVDTSKCLPRPSLPDTATYRVIGIIFGIAFLLIIFEAYGLRLRRLIMSKHYPERERVRTVWLYNQILRRRGGFRKFLKRNKKTEDAAEGTKGDGLISHLASRSKIMARILKICGFKWKFCVNCGIPGKAKDTEGFMDCANAGCRAIYCLECVHDVHNMCQICSRPVDYDMDFTVVDFERGSSDEETKDQRRSKDVEDGTLDEETDEDKDLDYSYQFRLPGLRKESDHDDEDDTTAEDDYDDDDDNDEEGSEDEDDSDEDYKKDGAPHVNIPSTLPPYRLPMPLKPTGARRF
ncbi:DC-STAMP domain-containing protein 2-like isoform X2 [Patiria miniata]|uniref:Dendritic cell-specific transmembrane protein-like domain-containing protein n=1 Tax=Patiria miniata TaxID=46514 RepID=A0A914BPG6_PATMI|nr:DC-STAMP domain-containing protein 2-like isoform X2 [Patiria miniata]